MVQRQQTATTPSTRSLQVQRPHRQFRLITPRTVGQPAQQAMARYCLPRRKMARRTVFA